MHNGICGHCLNRVSPKSIACTACGAAWCVGEAGNTACLVGFLIIGAGIFALVQMPEQAVNALGLSALGAFLTWLGVMQNRPAWYR